MPARVRMRTHTHTHTHARTHAAYTSKGDAISEAEGALSPRAQQGLEGGRMLRESNDVGGGTEEKSFLYRDQGAQGVKHPRVLLGQL